MRQFPSIITIMACLMTGCITAFAPAPAMAEGAAELPEDSRIKLLPYDETDVYTITTKYGYQTNVVFGPQEEVETISMGDHSMWQIIPAGNRLFIRPMEDDITTNMTVLTNRHSYQFDLKSVANDKAKGNIYVAQFVYKDTKKDGGVSESVHAAETSPTPPSSAPLPATSPFGAAPSIGPHGAQKAAIPPSYKGSPGAAVYPNYNYTYAGPDALAPLQVYDDGKSTYIKYSDMTKPLPGVSIVEAGGRQTPVTYTVKGDYMLVDAVAGEMALTTSAGTVHIFNEIINPK